MKLKYFKKAVELKSDIDRYTYILKRINNITNTKKANPVSIAIRFDIDDRTVFIKDSSLAETILDKYVDELNDKMFDLKSNFEKL
jgi:hypothetical protein